MKPPNRDACQLIEKDSYNLIFNVLHYNTDDSVRATVRAEVNSAGKWRTDLSQRYLIEHLISKELSDV